MSYLLLVESWYPIRAQKAFLLRRKYILLISWLLNEQTKSLHHRILLLPSFAGGIVGGKVGG